MALAQDTERLRAEAETTPAEAPPEVAPTDTTTFTTQGDLPAVADPSVQADPQSASDQAFGDVSYLDSGVHYWDEYREACVAAGKPEKWQDFYAYGHTGASQFDQPYERGESFEWALKKGQSASQAVKDWLAGPTIADYRAIGVAQELDELRDDLGEQTFDRLFGSTDGDIDATIPQTNRLMITSAMYTTPFVDKMKAIAAEAETRDAVAEVQPQDDSINELVEEKPQLPTPAPIVADELALGEREQLG
jgi:hypothetical protein